MTDSTPVASTQSANSGYRAVSALQFSFQELAEIYNQTRIDYIVPMPMNSKRMEEYVHFYDVDLDQSVVAYNADNAIAGVGMLGLRHGRAWITRLGVIPDRRGSGLGQFMMMQLLSRARRAGAYRVQLEVIAGNEPAYRLFLKLGFTPLRDLLVIRRPPTAGAAPFADAALPGVRIEPLGEREIHDLLLGRTEIASWVDEGRSVLRAGCLAGVRVRLPDGAEGRAVFRAAVFQLSHLVLDGDADRPDLTAALLAAVHERCAGFDTKVENLPADSPRWPVFQQFGYVEAFRRIEMTLTF